MRLYTMPILSKYVIIFGNITWINIFIIARRNSDANMHVFLYLKNSIWRLFYPFRILKKTTFINIDPESSE